MTRNEPLVAVIYSVPLLVEALEDALDGIGEVRAFPTGDGEVATLLEAIEPDAIVVDSLENADIAAAYAIAHGIAAVHVDFAHHMLHALIDGAWRRQEDDDSPDAVRNLVAGGIYGRGKPK